MSLENEMNFYNVLISNVEINQQMMKSTMRLTSDAICWHYFYCMSLAIIMNRK